MRNHLAALVLIPFLLWSSLAHAQFLFQTSGASQNRPELGAPIQTNQKTFNTTSISSSIAASNTLDLEPTGALRPPCNQKPEQRGVAEISASANDVANILDPVLTLTGKCPHSNQGKDLAENIAIDMRNRIGGNPKIRIKKEDGNFATTEDWVAVDLLARTLYGEVGGRNACASTDGYFEAIGKVIMNRAEFMHDPKHEKHTNFFKNQTSVRNDYAKAAISPHEFQVWQDASRYVMCPASEIQKSYKDKDGKVIASTSAFDYVRWFGALQVAADMIFKEKTFRCKTQNVKALFYSKSSIAPGKGFMKIQGVKVGDQQIDNASCVQLWKSPNAPFEPALVTGCP